MASAAAADVWLSSAGGASLHVRAPTTAPYSAMQHSRGDEDALDHLASQQRLLPLNDNGEYLVEAAPQPRMTMMTTTTTMMMMGGGKGGNEGIPGLSGKNEGYSGRKVVESAASSPRAPADYITGVFIDPFDIGEAGGVGNLSPIA